MIPEDTPPLRMVYRNHQNRIADRDVWPTQIWFGESEYHREEGPQWFMRAIDRDNMQSRDFLMADILRIERD